MELKQLWCTFVSPGIEATLQTTEHGAQKCVSFIALGPGRIVFGYLKDNLFYHFVNEQIFYEL